jgi:PAS domain S-box-containing protein/putative nucleotidyltransferase with HDIG domain
MQKQRAVKRRISKDGKGGKVRCWELFNCNRRECPAYRSRNLKCWLFSGTCCRDEIQGKFIEKMDMCFDCRVFKTNIDPSSAGKTLRLAGKQFKEFTRMLYEKDREIERISVELAVSMSEVFEALRKVTSGDPTVRITEISDFELIRKLKHMVNMTAANIGEIVDQSHEFAMGLAEHFDVLHRVTKGDLNARVTSESREELMEALKRVTNETIESISREIAERRRAEESLWEIEALESSILSAIPHAVVGFRERTIVFANGAVKSVFGWEPDELIGRSSRLLYRSDDEYEEIGRHFYPVLETRKTHSEEFPCRRKDGTDILCKTSAAVIGKQLKEMEIVAVYEDITEHKQMQEALRESEEKYHDLYQNAPDGYHSIGPDGTILEVNNTWLRMLGYDRDEVVGKMKLTDLLTDEGVAIFRETFPELKKRGFVENIDYSVRKKDGMFLPVIINATAVYDEEGNFLRSRSIVRDNSDRKAYQEKLKHAAGEWRSTFDSMPYGVMLLDADLRVIRTNDFVASLFHTPVKEFAGKNCLELIYGGGKPAEGMSILDLRTLTSTKTFGHYISKLNKYFMGYITPVFDVNGSVKSFVLSLVDVTESKENEKRILESHDAFLNMLKETDSSYKTLKELYTGLIRSFANAIDAKSPWTKGHSERVTRYALLIAEELGLKEKDLEDLRTAALLHDIGKIGTYDVILDKPDKLNAEELALIRTHPVKGEEILKPIKQLRGLLPIIRHHHERLDGKGYPDGLKDGEIPFLAKIITVADSFDSMTSDRPYRPAPPVEYAMSEIKRCSGTQFDPVAAEAFLRVLETKKGSK